MKQRTKTERILELLVKGKGGASIRGLDNAIKEELKLEDKQTWEASMLSEWEVLPNNSATLDDLTNPVYDTDGVTILYYKQIPNPNHTTLDMYKNETTPIIVGQDSLGNDIIVDQLVRPYVEPTILQTDVDAVKLELPMYKEYEAKLKADKLDTLVIDNNTVLYDMDGKAIGNMSAVVALANWKFNQALAIGTAFNIAYQTIYKDTTVTWKGADNLPHVVQVESICEALEKGLHAVANTIGVPQ